MIEKVDFLIIAIICIFFGAILRKLFDYNLKKIMNIAKNQKLDDIAKKYPSNIEICKKYLEILHNDNVIIEENKNAKDSLYMVVMNKIIIANIDNSYTRIQTIAHECLHSIQERKILTFNFIYSNIYLLYYILICVLTIFNQTTKQGMLLNVLLYMSLIYYMIRTYLEDDAMIKAKYLTKEYLEEIKISNKNEIKEMLEGFEKINKIGIRAMHYNVFNNVTLKILIYILICLIF